MFDFSSKIKFSFLVFRFFSVFDCSLIRSHSLQAAAFTCCHFAFPFYMHALHQRIYRLCQASLSCSCTSPRLTSKLDPPPASSACFKARAAGLLCGAEHENKRAFVDATDKRGLLKKNKSLSKCDIKLQQDSCRMSG